MKFIILIIVLFITVNCFSNSKHYDLIFLPEFNTPTDTLFCSKTFVLELNGVLTEESLKSTREYILNKKGICNVQFDLAKHHIIIDVIEEMDIDSIKNLVSNARHLYLLEGNDNKSIQ